MPPAEVMVTTLIIIDANIAHRKIAIGQPQTTGFHFEVPVAATSETASAMSSPVISTR